MIKTCGLVCILILQYGAVLTHSEVFFFEEELIIHSQKDLNNFYTNMESLNELTKHIDKSVNYFNSKIKETVLDNTIEASFSSWLKSEAEQCSSEIKIKIEKALNISLNSLPEDIHLHKARKRIKRGFKPLGNLISFLTDLPSPHSWERYEYLVDNLKQTVIGDIKLQLL